MVIDDYKPSEPCGCEFCKNSCKRPCWPTPEEADKLLDAGYADRLMLDYWEGDPDIYLLCGANPGYEGGDAPDTGDVLSCLSGTTLLQSGCTFMTEDGLCELHDLGLKPFEGRHHHHDVKSDGLHRAVAMTWKGDKGRVVIERWKKLVKY